MRLKRIKLAGFKSFVEPTSIPFPGSMTAIVGPNGCGKSNVIDAVRWVLGESSAKNLRGDAMTDVIFNGSTSRKPVGQCSVELVFDNAEGRLSGEYAKYAELSVKRLVTRDGQSTYFLNGTRCRRRDITDLFLGTGLGPRSYAIIEQGMISRLIESKPQELRVFIEEAAGISKYKERRRETETRIRHTLENLDRLSDVRSELGQQLEKLQRQAAAAERYTTLKKQERQLKSELAVIRYLGLNEKIQQLDNKIKQSENEFEALKARYHGDEAGIETYREKQRQLNVAMDDTQQTVFKLATQITRAEEAGQYREQRIKQIDALHQQLVSKVEKGTEEKTLLDAQLSEARSELDALLPEQALLAEQKGELQARREDAEEALQLFTENRRQNDERYHQKKRDAQACHGKIQSTMSMQMRTQQRLRELEEEKRTATDEMLVAQSESLEELKLQAKEEVDSCKADVERVKEKVTVQREKVQQAEDIKASAQALCNKHQATIDALEALQQQQDIDHEFLPLWQSLTVKPGFEPLVEQVLAHWGEPLITSSMAVITDDSPADTLPNSKRVVFSEAFTSQKRSGTLAEQCDSVSVPLLFNHIHCVDEDEEAFSLLPSIEAEESVIARSGLWLSNEWAIFGAGQLASGALQRQAKLTEQYQLKKTSEAALDHAEQALHSERSALADLEKQLDASNTALSHSQASLADVTQRHGLVAMQVEQNQARATKLDEELEKQAALLEQEQMQLEKLSESVELLEAEIFELETTQDDVEKQLADLQSQVSQARTQYDVVTQSNHETTLKVNALTQQVDHVQQSVSRLQSQLQEWKDEQSQLAEEKLALSNPVESDDEQLQVWLAARAEAEEQLLVLQQQMSEVEAWLSKAQQDQQGIQREMEAQSSIKESLNLEAEGFRVRASGVLEQLKETGHTVKETMETLPEDAQENTWQQRLEQTTASLKRLGAVNLAAVEEYKVQAERKKHLDDQNDDLNDALETLQSAIRKIDKETRTRFSTTFDQVNSDLKSLFPKVFGGGSAYLALTDDDLLETGVTIMARPPGKKNSTIHLLSGGEKALTALSLVFAIFRLNPAPFCLLDEVDAPLDDANVGRFCNLVSEMSNSVQFIYITHNKIAMEMASHLTGVTMAEPGVSRMVAVDVDEAVSMVQA
ncbi:chromosome segregation protein SMC [Alteromonas sediminis]|uniref:Chromosome partition protein Smc n=1 Tax=Alteromonas sediminis TaxID=2259342 RepID=A0A3N5Y3A5_9ALTE|nr:chromosome segregation protein SMC [Alteromonas sediminis]RPJ67613.1 chromosome segregation protein SMC [Alteromonas sediminis]